jgi:hypothetical protein
MPEQDQVPEQEEANEEVSVDPVETSEAASQTGEA